MCVGVILIYTYQVPERDVAVVEVFEGQGDLGGIEADPLVRELALVHLPE